MSNNDKRYHIVAGEIISQGGIVLSVANPATAAGLAEFTGHLAGAMQLPVHLISVIHPQEPNREAVEPQQWPALEQALAVLNQIGVAPSWVVCRASNVGHAIRQIVRKIKARTVVLGWHGKPRSDGAVVNLVLKDLLQDPQADIVVVGGGPIGSCRRILVPYSTGPHSELALRLGIELLDGQQSPGNERQMTALHVTPPNKDKPSAEVRENLQRALKSRDKQPDHLLIREAAHEAPAQAIINEVRQGYDLVLMGTSSEEIFDQVLFGTLPRQIAENCGAPIVVVRHHTGALPRALKKGWRKLFTAMPKLNSKERAEVKTAIRKSAAISPDFITMLLLSTMIAAFGLLLNSPAVIIGAMLVAPLMSAIIGLALASVYGDRALLGDSARTAGIGVALAIAVSWLIGILVPNTAATAEILGRTHPNLLDLFVALAAGAAGAYALCRKEVASSLAGVAIAVALVPPLASVGILLSLQEFSLAGGAALLFITNLIAIAAAGTVVFLLLGFAPPEIHKERRRILRRSLWGVVAMLTTIAVVLGFLSFQTIREARFNQTLRHAVTTQLNARLHADLVDASFTTNADGALLISATVRASDIVPPGEIVKLQTDLAQRLQRPVGLELTVLPVTRLTPTGPSE